MPVLVSSGTLFDRVTQILLLVVTLGLFAYWVWTIVRCSFDRSLAGAKTFWLIVVVLGTWVGALIYDVASLIGGRRRGRWWWVVPSVVGTLLLIFVVTASMVIARQNASMAVARQQRDADMAVFKAKALSDDPAALAAAQEAMKAGDAQQRAGALKAAAVNYAKARALAEGVANRAAEGTRLAREAERDAFGSLDAANKARGVEHSRAQAPPAGPAAPAAAAGDAKAKASADVDVAEAARKAGEPARDAPAALDDAGKMQPATAKGQAPPGGPVAPNGPATTEEALKALNAGEADLAAAASRLQQLRDALAKDKAAAGPPNEVAERTSKAFLAALDVMDAGHAAMLARKPWDAKEKFETAKGLFDKVAETAGSVREAIAAREKAGRVRKTLEGRKGAVPRYYVVQSDQDLPEAERAAQARMEAGAFTEAKAAYERLEALTQRALDNAEALIARGRLEGAWDAGVDIRRFTPDYPRAQEARATADARRVAGEYRQARVAYDRAEKFLRLADKASEPLARRWYAAWDDGRRLTNVADRANARDLAPDELQQAWDLWGTLGPYDAPRQASTLDEAFEVMARGKQLFQQAIDVAEGRRSVGPPRQAADEALSLARTIYRAERFAPTTFAAAQAAMDAGQAQVAKKAFDEAKASFARAQERSAQAVKESLDASRAIRKVVLRSAPAAKTREGVVLEIKEANLNLPEEKLSGTLRHDYDVVNESRSGKLVNDYATGLMWFQPGSAIPGRTSLDQLLEFKPGGFSDWRVPTIVELASLMEPTRNNGAFIDPIFPAMECRTADRVPDIGGRSRGIWVVQFGFGNVMTIELTGNSLFRGLLVRSR